MSLNESLEEATPADVIRRLAAQRRTGAVRFAGDAGCTVYLHGGRLYFARDDQTDEALATALVRPGRLTPEDWTEAVTRAGDAPTVGEILVRRKSIDADLLASVTLSVFYDPLIRLFRAPSAAHQFEPDTVHWLGPFRAFSVDAIIAEVEKRSAEIDAWAWLIPSVGVFVSAQLTLPGTAPHVTLRREDWELVTALASAHSIAQLAARLGRGQFSTARVVHRLASAGLVEVQPDIEPPLPARPRHETLPAHDQLAASSAARADPDLVEAGLAHRLRVRDLDHSDAEMDAAFGQPDLDAMARWAGNGDGSPSGASHNGSSNGVAAVAVGHGGSVETLEPEQEVEAEPELDPNRDPNAVWLENLYAKYIDEPDTAATANGKRRKGEPTPHQVAFATQEQTKGEKVGTLKRLMGALKRL